MDEPSSSEHADELRAALARLALMHDDVLVMAYQMRCVYSSATIHEHLVKKALAMGAPVCWEVGDLSAYFMSDSPEPLLPARRLVAPPPERIRAALPHLLLGSGAAFEVRDGQLRLKRQQQDAPSDAPSEPTSEPPSCATGEEEVAWWLSDLGECADPRCGCYRPTHPEVRVRFREAVLASIPPPSSRAHRGLRYVTVGGGGLLYDLELLLALRRSEHSLDLVVAVDKRYWFDGAAPLRLRSILSPDGTEVHAFGHLDSYVASATAHPDTFGRADLYVQCDCDDVDDDQAARAARAVLAPEGVALVLRGDGSFQRVEAGS